MVKHQKSILHFILIIVITFTPTIVFSNQIFGQVKPITQIQEKLKGISDEEKDILAHLFILLQEIEEMDRNEKVITRRIEALQEKTEDLESVIQKHQKDYDNQLEILKQVLVSYQRSGPASYLEVLLSAEDLNTFLRSINTIRDVTRNTGELLDSLEKGKNELTVKKEYLAGNMVLLENQKEELKEALTKKLKLKKEQEAYLDSLKEGREYYQEQLDNLQQMWDEVKVVFSKITEEFTRITKEGKVPLEALNLKLGFPAIKGTIYEETLSDILKEHSSLPNMVFHFYPEKIHIEIPEKNLSLIGTFSIDGKSTLKFMVEEGSFYGMPLEAASIEELFRDGYLMIDFKEFMDNITLNSIEIMEGYMEFKIKPFI